MMTCSYALACFLMACTAVSDWKVPEKPDPSAILEEAEDDTRAKRFDTALAKHIWYHRNALKVDPGQYGVRLSFALTSWKKLADKFEPAMVAFKEERELAKARVVKGEDIVASFHDYTAFNRVLDDDAATMALFLEVEQKQPTNAAKIYRLAEGSLIRAKDYSTCGKYIDPDEFMKHMQGTVEGQLKQNTNVLLRNFSKRSFTHQSSTLVALLVVNNRREEAVKIADRARKELADVEFHRTLDEALTGKVPEPLR